SSWVGWSASAAATGGRRCCSSAAPTTRSLPPTSRKSDRRQPPGAQMTITPDRHRPDGPVTVGTPIPRPPPHAMLGVMVDVWRDRLGLMTVVTEDFGDAVRFKLGPKSLYFFNHPDHAKHVLADNAANYHKGIGLVHAKKVLGDGLLTSEGELWKRQRKTINPAFRRGRLA